MYLILIIIRNYCYTVKADTEVLIVAKTFVNETKKPAPETAVKRAVSGVISLQNPYQNLSCTLHTFMRQGGTMKHYIFGYPRVSTEQQNLDRQLDMLNKYGVDKINTEKMTGTKRDRPELKKLLERMTEGDTVVIESLSRLGRSTKDLIELVDLFDKEGVQLVSLKESIDTSTPAGKLLFTLMSAIAQFERDVIAERTMEGLEAARARGRNGGRPRTDDHKLQQAVKLYNAGQHTVKEIEELTGVKKATLYRNVNM